MKILISKYKFENPKLEGGALLKVVWGIHQIGYADLICHPKLGDLPLETHLQSLIEGTPTQLSMRALSFAAIDAKARRQSQNLLFGLALPKAHKMVRNLESVQLAQQNEFSHIKIKMGTDLNHETQLLEEVAKIAPELKIRLDFNGRLTFSEFSKWWAALAKDIKSQIDFIEDAYSDSGAIDAPLAWDWLNEPLEARVERIKRNQKKIQVIKPSHHSIEGLEIHDRVVFTHAMGHWLGQAAALWAAARFYQRFPHQREVCGLSLAPALSSWPQRGPMLTPPPGTGFGFDDLLQEQKWERF